MPTGRNKLLFSLLNLGLSVCTLCTRPAFSYEVSEAKWDVSDFPVDYWIDPQVLTEAGGEAGIQVIRSAFRRWADLPSSSFDASYQGLKVGFVAADHECHIMWGDLGSGGPFSPPLAQTFAHSMDGRIIDADIIFNDFYSWAGPQLAITALHEIGHLCGLSHSTSRYAVMYSTSAQTELHPDDIEGITFLYPAPHLCDLIPVGMLYPLYVSSDSNGPLAALIQNVGFPIGATIETTIYVSSSPDFGDVTTFIGKGSVPVDATGPVTVHFPPRSFGQPDPLYFGLGVDTARQAFESDETNNLEVIRIPVVPWEANGDQDLSGLVDGLDLFLFASHWQERYSLPWRYRFDFAQRNLILEEDLILLLSRWHIVTLPQ